MLYLGPTAAGDDTMKKVLIGIALLAVAGVAFAASGLCPFCLF
jgi:hypothetical protein